jgi:2-polyprenyl-3-methyl-5-hydroxy-6-metoxy-1,4-benzoquinol methylase
MGGIEVGRLLDVGAGSGFFARQLLALTGAREATCVDIGYAHEHDEEVAGKPLRFRRDSGPIAVDCVLMIDVLEHVDDDRALLAEYVEKTTGPAHFLIAVPAFSFAWGTHDDFLGHRRRYTLRRLEAVVRAAALVPVSGRYYFALILPIALAQRIGRRLRPSPAEPASDLRSHSPLVNRLLAAVCRVELPLLAVNRLAGLSVLCLARKA